MTGTNGDALQILGELFTAQPLAVLASRSAAGAYANLVAFAATDDLRSVLFATTLATRKYANLSAHPEVAFLIDDRTNTLADFRDAVAVTALGTAAPVAPEDRTGLRAQYLARHPHLVDFLRSPTTVLFRTEIERYIIVQHFQQVIEVVFDGADASSP